MKTLLQEHDFKLFKRTDYLIGIDEVGRGALAGPVMATAFRLQNDSLEDVEFLEKTVQVRDSKKMSIKAREKTALYMERFKASDLIDFESAEASVQEIKELNILNAATLAMERALKGLLKRIQKDARLIILVDGKPLKNFLYEHEAIIGGDNQSLSIALASVMAKVNRDQYMTEQGQKFPHFQFHRNKGYGTKVHRKSLREYGACEMHRELFVEKTLKSRQT